MAIDYELIGKRLQDARISNDLTQEKLAEVLDVSVAYLSRVECGTTQINLKRLFQICDFLNADIGFILTGTSKNSKNYFTKELSSLLESCPPEKTKLIYDIANLIIHDKQKEN